MIMLLKPSQVGSYVYHFSLALVTMLHLWRQGVELRAPRWLCIDGAENDPQVCVLLYSKNNSIHSYMILMFQISINHFSP